MITLKNLSLHFANRPIFDEINATILQEDRIGLVGSNGAGKTTLLKTLAHEQDLDGGAVLYGPQIKIGYLPQDGLIAHKRSLFAEVESAATEVLAVRAKQAALEEALGALPDSAQAAQREHLINEISECDDELLQLDAYRLPSEIETILLGLGFKITDMDRQTSEFSGGWQMRIALAKLLLAKPQLLLLDEPTNHLDLPSQRWLERFLETYPGAIMTVSHDQAFLDTLCTKIYEISRGKLTIYTGNYSEYEDQKVARALALQSAYETQQRKLAKTQQFVDRFRAKASKAGQVQSRLKALDKVERIEIEREESSIGFRFPHTRPTGQQVIKVKGIRYGYSDQPLFEELEALLEKGEKVGIVGPNGAGKTTLLKILAGVVPMQAGERVLGHSVELAYFAQHQAEELDPKKTVLDTVTELLSGVDKTHPRTVLGSLLFSGSDAFKPVHVLSGGEKNRLALAKILLMGANCLLLDEPTNHLDMRSKKVLQTAIKDFQGAAIIVSHDRAFLDPLVSKVWEIRDRKVHVFHGNVSAYIAWYEAQQIKEAKERNTLSKATSSSAAEKLSLEPERITAVAHTGSKNFRKAQAASAERVKKLEAQVQALENKRDSLENDLADPELFKRDPATAHQRVREHADIVTQLENTWEAWSQAQQTHLEQFGG